MNAKDLQTGLKFAALNSALTAFGCAVAALVILAYIAATKKTA